VKIEFEKALPLGESGERLIGEKLIALGYHITAMYLYDHNCPPKAIGPTSSYTYPDILCMRDGKSKYVDVKIKSEWLSRIYNEHCTGIDHKFFEAYRELSNISGTPVYLVFIQCGLDKVGENGCYSVNIDTSPVMIRDLNSKKMAIWAKSQLLKINQCDYIISDLRPKLIKIRNDILKKKSITDKQIFGE